MCDRCYHGRLLPLPLSNYLPKIKTMAYLKIQLPVYNKTLWETIKKDGTLEVSAEVDSLSEGYEMLKKQLDNLLAELDAQNRLAEDVETLKRPIEEKARDLKCITKDIEIATEDYKCLRLFLERLGIDQNQKRLNFDKQFLLSQASASEVEVVAENIYPGKEF
jgi:hypothetical protein